MGHQYNSREALADFLQEHGISDNSLGDPTVLPQTVNTNKDAHEGIPEGPTELVNPDDLQPVVGTIYVVKDFFTDSTIGTAGAI